MFVIRQAQPDDLPTLLKLARMVHFINLPADRDIIAAKIARSRLSFQGQAPSEREREFMFVLEHVESESVVGTCAVLSCISWPGHPHTYLKVSRREHFSRDLQSGSVHVTLQLGTDETGPSELGGLILAPGYRGHPARLGSLLSLIRLHYVGLHREWFSERIIAEMMGALTPDSRNLLWEYLGRRFINLQYSEADRFCQHSKEFITSLLPPGEIYAALLPPEARNLIGRVGEETRPALAMLERQGFASNEHVDPFDGGPYIGAQRDRIPIVAATRRATLADPQDPHPEELPRQECFVSCDGDEGFRAVRCLALIDGDNVAIPAESAGLIGAQPGEAVGVTPLTVHQLTGADRAAERGAAAPSAAGSDGAMARRASSAKRVSGGPRRKRGAQR
ncbi:MAG TPA: arginine N-succinyltransferase [Phycisphaerales bacterium]|nr:arginine N-succinyltransferase [Phycisphaerales bacterium]HMP37906.1 arginine N-succinyltransferase [Phycisphaerales bacterium]